MEISNKKSIKGIFLYAPDIKFERGDFVVEGDKLYVTKADSMGNLPSQSPDYFQIYLKEDIADLDGEDFINYLKGEGQDKLISAYTVGKLLNMYLSGFDEKGIITNEITDNGSIILKDYFGNEVTSSHTNPLDVILTEPNLNNAIFKVDRGVVKSLIGSSSTTSRYVLLRQYTYLETDLTTSVDNIYTRVQELIDEETGIVKYRYSRSSNSYEPSTDWVSLNTNSEFTSMVDEVINYYSNKCIELDKQKAILRDSFRFKNIKYGLPTETSEKGYSDYINGNSPLVIYTVKNPISNNSFAFFTICTTYAEVSTASSESGGNPNIYRTDSITVDLLPFYKSSLSRRYGIVGDKYIDITSNINLGIITFSTSGGSYISNIYMRESLRDIDSSLSEGNIQIAHGLEDFTKIEGVYEIPLSSNPRLTMNKNISLSITTKLPTQTAVFGLFVPNTIAWKYEYEGGGSTGGGLPPPGEIPNYVSKKVTLSASLNEIPEVSNLEDKSKYLIVTAGISEPIGITLIDAEFFTARVGLCKYQGSIYIKPIYEDLNATKFNMSGHYIVPADVFIKAGSLDFLSERLSNISIDSVKVIVNE